MSDSYQRRLKGWRCFLNPILIALLLGVGVRATYAAPPEPYLVKDINPTNSSSGPYQLTVVNDTFFFGATDGSRGHELYKSDGTAEGTVLVKDLNPGWAGSRLEYLTDVGGVLFFMAFDDDHGFELWKSDGTVTGTLMIKDINPGPPFSYPQYLTGVEDMLFFSAAAGYNSNLTAQIVIS